MVEERRTGERITITTRAISNSMVDRKSGYEKIVEVFEESNRPLTVKEIAIILFKKGLIPTDGRHEIAPRITEMDQNHKKWIRATGIKEKDEYSGRPVAYYELAMSPEEIRKEIKVRVRKEVNKYE